jgi:hypothetical protein
MSPFPAAAWAGPKDPYKKNSRTACGIAAIAGAAGFGYHGAAVKAELL